MLEFLNRPYSFVTDLRYSLKMSSGLAIGIFLFILFFQPFGLSSPDLESYILTIAGFSGITLIMTSLVLILLPFLFRGWFREELWDLKREILLLALVWILNSVAFCFYLAYVGKIELSMFLAFKAVVISLVFSVVIWLNSELQRRRNLLLELSNRNKILETQVLEKDMDAPVELVSENRSDKMLLDKESILLLRSAENYVEIVYRGVDQSVQKKLLRSTMKAIEDQLKTFSVFVRCHRTCIINTAHVISMQRSPQGIKLNIEGLEETVPVSRQYLLVVKASLEKAV
jgi:DNA-binding LytR/AlgR family response regulator